MGKFASFVRNLISIIAVFLLAHLGYKLYILTEKITEMIIKLDTMNGTMKELFEILKNLKIKWF